MNLFKIGKIQINLDSQFKTIWKIISKQYPFEEPFKVYAVKTWYRWGGSHAKYRQIEIKGLGKVEKIALVFYEDTDQTRLYSIYANMKSGHMYSLYNVQDNPKLKTITDPEANKIIKEALS